MIAIIMALTYLIDLPQSMFRVLFCVDSMSVLQSIKSFKSNADNFLLHEICHLIHVLICKGTNITFCWIPSHCGIFGNELADKWAKKGAKNEACAISINIPYTLQGGYHMLKKVAWFRFKNYFKTTTTQIDAPKTQLPNSERIMNISYLQIHNMYQYRHFISTFYRLKLDALRTKYSSTTKCISGETTLSSNHVLFECIPLRAFLPSLSGMSFLDVFSDSDFAFTVTFSLIRSPVGYLL